MVSLRGQTGRWLLNVKNSVLINEIRGLYLCLQYYVILILGVARVKSSLCVTIADGERGRLATYPILSHSPPIDPATTW